MTQWSPGWSVGAEDVGADQDAQAPFCLKKLPGVVFHRRARFGSNASQGPGATGCHSPDCRPSGSGQRRPWCPVQGGRRQGTADDGLRYIDEPQVMVAGVIA